MATTAQIILGRSFTLVTSATRYTCLDGGTVMGATETQFSGICSIAGILRNLKVEVSAAPGTGGSGKKWEFTVYKNGNPTDLTVTILETATTATFSGDVSVAAGDYLSLEIKPTGTPTASTIASWACEYISTTNHTLLMGSTGGSGITNNQFLAPKASKASNATEFNEEIVIPCDGTISDFYVRTSAASGAGKTITYTVRKNSGDTSLAVAIVGASQVTGNDTDGGHAFTVVAGDTITIQRTGDTTTQQINVGLNFTPDTVGNFIIARTSLGTALNGGGSAASYDSINCGGLVFNTTETNYDQVSYAFTIKNIYIEFNSAEASNNVPFTLRLNAGNSALAVTMVAGNTSANASADVTIADDDKLNTRKDNGVNSGKIANISYTGYRIDISTIQETILSNAIIKRIEQETILSNAKLILARELKTITSNATIKTINNQETITSNTKIKVLGNQESILSNAYISHSILETILSNAIIKQIGVINTINANAAIKVPNNQETITSNASIIGRIQETIKSNARITIVYNGKFIHNTDLFIITDGNPAQIIKVDITNPAIYSKYNVGAKINGKAVCINHTTEFLYASLNNGYVAKISLVDPSIQVLFYVGENVQLYSIAHNPTYLTTFIADGVADDSLFTLDEATYGKINTDFRTQISTKNEINTWFGTTMGSKINTDFRMKKETEGQIYTDLRFIKNTYTAIPSMARTDFHIYVDAVELGNDDLKLDSIKIVHTVDNKDTASFILLRKHDDIDNPTEITNNNVVTIYLNTTLEFTGKIIKANCNSETEYIEVYCETDNVNEVYNIITKDLPLPILNAQLHPYDVLVNNVYIENPYLSSNLVIVGNSNKYWTGSAWTLRLTQALTFATSSLAETYISNKIKEYIDVYAAERNLDFNIPIGHIYTYSDLEKYIQITIDDTFLKQYPVVRNYEENPQYYRGIRVYLGKQIQQSVEKGTSSASTTGIAQALTDGTFKFRPGYSYFWFASVYWLNLTGGYRPSGWQYIGSSLSSLATDLYEITGADYYFQKINEDIETDLGYYYLGTAPYKDISVKNGKKIIASRYEDKADGLYTVTDEGYDYEAYAKAIAAIEYEKIKDINGNILPKASADINLTIDGYLYYSLKLLTKINIANTTSTNIYKNDNGFPISIKQISIDSTSMRVNITADNTKSNWELERLTDSSPDEPEVQKDTKILENRKFDLSNWETVDE